MAFYIDPIHGRLKALIQSSGGYDFDFHMESVAARNNISKEIVIEIYCLTTNEEKVKAYIELYKSGKTLEEIREIHRIAVNESMFKLDLMMNSMYMMNPKNMFIKR